MGELALALILGRVVLVWREDGQVLRKLPGLRNDNLDTQPGPGEGLQTLNLGETLTLQHSQPDS